MRVDLAAEVIRSKLSIILCSNIIVCLLYYAQVLSESISQALYLTGGSEAFETAYFIGMVDKFFDCLNVTFYDQGWLRWKPFQQPYQSKYDFRLKVPKLAI